MSDLDAFLQATDLDALAAARERLGEQTAAEQSRLTDVANGPDEQGRANLLMHPSLLPDDVRLDALLAGLREGTGSYAALAAAVGVGEVDAQGLPDDRRGELLSALLDLVAADADVSGTRAAVAVQGVSTAADAAEIVPLLLHPARPVRHNLLVALLGSVGTAGLRALLDSPGFVDPDDADAVLRRLDEDGVRLDDDLVAPMPLLPLLPDRAEWRA